MFPIGHLLFKDGKNIFITGKAGTGKTFLLQKIVVKYKGNKYFAVLSPTGIAAEKRMASRGY